MIRLATFVCRLATFVVSLATLVGCGAAYQPNSGGLTPSPISTGQPTASTQPIGPAAEIEIMVSGGEFDGSYRAEATNVCESTPTENTFSVSYANESAADGFVALELLLRDAALAQEDASNDFLLVLSLNGVGIGASYTLDPADGEGEGDAFLDITDGEATLDLSVITPEAIIDLTVICDLV
jgi:hypothetical protein